MLLCVGVCVNDAVDIDVVDAFTILIVDVAADVDDYGVVGVVAAAVASVCG